uniref:Uncharacterized protein n=1 Tax=viral metagenome TaxID=1070528 RepID=A0A6M3LW58_9ZZZZ
MEQKSKEQVMKEMDEAALLAEKDLAKLDKKAIETIGTWIKKHYMKSGYKRLCRLLTK